MAWYDHSFHQSVSNRIPNSRSLLILQRRVRALTNHCEVASTDAPLLVESWLSAYPQRHRPELFL